MIPLSVVSKPPSFIIFVLLYCPPGLTFMALRDLMILNPTKTWWMRMLLSSAEGPRDGPNCYKGNHMLRRTWQVQETELILFNVPILYVCNSIQSLLEVKRYVRKGVPNEHRASIWMAASGAQEQLESNTGYYQSLLTMEHDIKLKETIHTGKTGMLLIFYNSQMQHILF